MKNSLFLAILTVLATLRVRSQTWLARLPGNRTTFLANVAEGTHDGNITKTLDADTTERYQLCKVGSAAGNIAICGAADVPIGVITDEGEADDDINVRLLNSGSGTVLMVASAAIAQGALLEPAASGRVATAATGTSGTHHLCGRALTAASGAGDVIEVDPFYGFHLKA